MNSNYKVPVPENEPILSYAPNSPERSQLKNKLEEMYQTTLEIPLIIHGEEVKTGKIGKMHMPT